MKKIIMAISVVSAVSMAPAANALPAFCSEMDNPNGAFSTSDVHNTFITACWDGTVDQGVEPVQQPGSHVITPPAGSGQ